MYKLVSRSRFLALRSHGGHRQYIHSFYHIVIAAASCRGVRRMLRNLILRNGYETALRQMSGINDAASLCLCKMAHSSLK
jgi:hypothetical protein